MKKLPVLPNPRSTSLHATWMTTLLGEPLPDEPLATCDDCALLPDPNATQTGALADKVVAFNPTTKCCTFSPTLPNFLVGRILRDTRAEMAEGRARITSIVARKIGVTPLGIAAEPVHRALYRPGAFGRAAVLRCPLYVVGPTKNCSIWAHRNAVCSTWFCKHTRGSVSEQFWRAVQDVLAITEHALTYHALLEVGVDARSLMHLRASARESRFEGNRVQGEELDDRVDAREHARAWGSWDGREAELYAATADVVAAMSFDDVQRAGGAELRAASMLAKEARETLRATRRSKRLTTGDVKVTTLSASAVRVVGYSAFDPLDMPPELLALLPLFEGLSTREAVRNAKREAGVDVSPALLEKLVDFGILVDETKG